VHCRNAYSEVEGVAERQPNGLGDVRLDLVSAGESPPPTAVCDRFRLGRSILLGVRNSVLGSMADEPGVEGVETEEAGSPFLAINLC